MFGFITTRSHDEIVAAKDAELEILAKDAHHWWERYNRRSVEAADLRARLAVFTAPRARGANGRFVKGEGR